MKGSVRIQYKCLVPIYVFPEMKLCVQPRLIYFQDRSVYFAAATYVDRYWEYINRSQTHECRNWAETVQFLFWEYINWIFGSVLRL